MIGESLLTSKNPYLEYIPMNAEYDKVASDLKRSLKCEDICISVLLRVKNPALEAEFQHTAAAITEKRGGKVPEIVDVYHGTTMDSAESIAEKGFDPAYSKVAAYGKGTYASPSAKMALGYCKDVKERSDFSMLFKCKFLKGKYGATANGSHIDTAVADYSGSGEILVTPYKNGILPEYLICYYKW